MNILAVDDDAMSLLLIEQSLTALGHQVTTAEDGAAAQRLLEQRHFHVVLTDWEMPVMNGLELCSWIRSRLRSRYVYIIMLTSSQSSAAMITGMEAGADEFITKPADPDALRVRLRAAERIAQLQSRDLAIFAMAKLAEARDPETGAHLDRIREYVGVVSTSLQSHPDFKDILTPAYVNILYTAAPLHDIGKIGIPDSILLKAGRLTESEFQVMKTHTTIGAETLNAAINEYPDDEYLSTARDIALTHHERFDGSGYPRGLSGEEIPLCGRIVALADVYDALISARVYKTAMPHELAREIIVKERGRHFDARMVDAFLKSEDLFQKCSRE